LGKQNVPPFALGFAGGALLAWLGTGTVKRWHGAPGVRGCAAGLCPKKPFLGCPQRGHTGSELSPRHWGPRSPACMCWGPQSLSPWHWGPWSLLACAGVPSPCPHGTGVLSRLPACAGVSGHCPHGIGVPGPLPACAGVPSPCAHGIRVPGPLPACAGVPGPCP